MASSPHGINPLLSDKKLFCFGFGYTASYLAQKLKPFGWKISGTTTETEKKTYLQKQGIETCLFDQNHPITDPHETFSDVTHLLLSVPPDADGDPVFNLHAQDLAALKNLEWVGYLSTIGVYGNQDGLWIDETAPTSPTSRRGSLRLKAEQQWETLCLNEGFPLHIFRLSGIYGPGRSAIDSVRSGTAKRIEKEGHAFNRVHVEDIVQTLIASMNSPRSGSIYNLADDAPSPSHEVIQFACNLIGIDPPPLIPFDQAEMPPIVRSFYKDNKRIKNDKIKDELGIELLYADYRRGLQACLHIEDSVADFLDFEDSHSSGV